MAFLSLYSSSSQPTTKPASSSSHTAAAVTTPTTPPTTTTKARAERPLPARPPLAQLLNADTTPVSMNTDEPMDPTTEDDRRKSQRRRSSRADALSRRGSLPSSLHSPSPHRPVLDENIPSTAASVALYENLASFTFGSHSTKHDIAPFADPDPGDDDDDDEERMRNDRAKMRAIDDGTRRPSLPSNIVPDLASPLGERRPSQPINIPRPPQQSQSPVNTAPNSLEAWPVGSWPNESTPSPTSSAQPDGEDASAALAGFDLNFILEGSNNVNEAPAAQNVHSTFLSTFSAFSQTAAAGRRPSNVSTLSEQNDTFFRHVGKNDVEYSDRRRQWSFKRRTIGAPKDKSGNPTQMWECAIAGKFNVNRCRSSRESIDGKAQPLRLLIRPYLPPTSPTSSSRHPAHPSVLIHKHSRANAFSIFRAGKLRTAHMSASHCVLLAPLKVQVHYTETRSTRALKTYNFLDDKVLPDDKDDSCSNRSERRNSPELMDIQEHTYTNAPPVAGPSSLRMSPQIILSNSPRSPQRAPISPLPEEEEQDEADLELDGKGYVRKSHADAFATLDEKQLEAHRQARLTSPSEPVPIPIEVNRVRQSRFGSALKRAFAGSPVQPHPDALVSAKPNDDINGGVFNPPWLTTTPRALQEKNARTLHQLNKSFEDVGLLPHRRRGGPMQRPHDPLGITGKNGTINGKTRHTRGQHLHGEAFEEIPEDSPVMLLPMWANEEVALGQQGKARKDYVGISSIPIHERRYLLIYYTSFAPADDHRSGANGRDRGTKKRTRSTVTNGDLHRSASERNRHQGEHLTSFRAVAKVLSYDDVRMSGLRLPNEGIEISPSISPNSPAPDGVFPSLAPVMSTFGDTMVIAICPSPESAIEFVPEGLDKLGLCYRPGDLPISSIADPAESERLIPIGRAIVEMAWVGCLCVMGLASTL